jgi:excisionase family DNA binding protein
MATIGSPLIDADELAELLRIKPQTVMSLARLTGADGLPSVKLGRRRRFRIEDVSEAIGTDLRAGPLLTAGDVGEMLKLKQSSVQELARRQSDPLPSLHVGGRRRYELARVEEWLARQEG